MTPGITGNPGKCPWKYHSLAVTPLIPTIRLASASYSTIRSTSRNGQRWGISASISRVEWMVSVTGDSRTGGGQCRRSGHRRAAWSVQVCIQIVPRGLPATGSAGSRSRRRGEECRAPDAVEQVRRHPTLQERVVGQQRLVDRHVGDQAIDHQFVERDATAGDGSRPVRAPDDELAEERVVERRDLVAAVQGRIHPHPRSPPRGGALDDPRARPELVLPGLGIYP